MSTSFSLEEIRSFWRSQALTHGQSSDASWSDSMVIEMEIREILKHLSAGGWLKGAAPKRAPARRAPSKPQAARATAPASAPKAAPYFGSSLEDKMRALIAQHGMTKARRLLGLSENYDKVVTENTDQGCDKVVTSPPELSMVVLPLCSIIHR